MLDGRETSPISAGRQGCDKASLDHLSSETKGCRLVSDRSRDERHDQRAALLADLQAAVRLFQQEDRVRRLRRGTAQPRTKAEQTTYDEGVARRTKRLARRRARAAAALAERIGTDVIDLDALAEEVT